MRALFYISLSLIAYVYFGYPLALHLGLFGRRRAFHHAPILPTISVIVPAHNEEANIEAKLRNILACDYPRDLVEILIGSDGSSDRTEDIVRRFADQGVGLISFPKQLGKSAMQNGLVSAAGGQILILTDADCFLACDTLRRLTEHFADNRVGLVTARPRYANENETGITRNEGLYLRYETWMRAQESARGILAMASGSCFAMRRELWSPLDRAEGDDFVLPLRVAEAGRINLLDPRVVALTRLSQNRPVALLRLKSRIISKDFRALLMHPRLLNPFRRGPLAASLWSHKMLRWMIPYFLLALLSASFALRADFVARAVLLFQLSLYTFALLGSTHPSRSAGFPAIPQSFCLVNLAALLGTIRCVTGRTTGRWTPDRPRRAPSEGHLAAPGSGAK